MSSDTSNNVKMLMGGKPESNGKGKGKGQKGQAAAPDATAPAPIVEAPVAEAPASLTPPPPAPAPVTTPATAPVDPLDVPFVLHKGLALACDHIPSDTRKATSQVTLPPQVVSKAKGIMGKANATPEAIAEALQTYADAASSVLDLPSGDVVLMALEQGLEREHKEGIASAKAKRAHEEALRRAKVRDDLQKGITGLAISDLPAKLIEYVNLAQKEGLFLVIHGPLDSKLANDKQAQGSGIFVRDKSQAPARVRTPGEGGESTGDTFQYFDDSKGGAQVTISLTKYLTDTYPGSATVKVMTDLAARRESGETKSRISPWDAYQKGLKATPPDTFVIRQVKVAATPAPATAPPAPAK